MTYGTIKVDTVTFTNDGVDKSVTLSGLVQNPTFSGNVTVTGTLSGVTVTGTTANFTSGNFTNISGGTQTIASGVFATGSAASPSITFTGDLNTGIYSPGADQVAISTGGSGRLFVDASGNVGIGGSASFPLDVITSGITEYTRFAGNVAGSVYSVSQNLAGAGNGRGCGHRLKAGNDNVIGELYAQHEGGTTNGSITLYGWRGGSQYANLAFDNNYSGSYYSSPIAHIFNTAGTERLRITSAGLVGVGTSSPSTKLEIVDGTDNNHLTLYKTGVAGGAGPGIRFNNQNNIGNSAYIAAITTELTSGTPSQEAGALVLSTRSTSDATPQKRIYVSATGQVGIGTTSPGVLLDVAGGNSIRVQASSSSISLPTGLALTTGFGVSYLSSLDGSGNAVDFGGVSANFIWSADTHRFTNRPATTEYVRIDSSGRLLVGTSSGSYKFQINALGSTGFVFDDTNGAISNTFGTGGNLTLRAQVASSSGGGEIYLGGSTRGDSNINSIVLSTANTERLRIGANGYMHASNTGSYYSTGTFHELSGNSATDASLLVGSFNTSKNHGNTSACLVVADYDSDYTDSNLFGGWNVTNNSWRILIRGNGNVENVNNSYGALSDAKLKENIVNAGSQWDDIKALQVRKYNFKEGQTHIQIGLIAQEVELVSPGLVSESPDRDEDGNALGTVTKSVNYSVLYMKAVKALQEAMERIETLEAKVAALEA